MDELDIPIDLSIRKTMDIMREHGHPTHSRITWAPDNVNIDYTENDDGTVTIQLAITPIFPDGTGQIAELMDELDIPIDLSIRKTMDIMREHGHPTRQEMIRQAMKMRRQSHLRDPFA